MKTFKDLEFKPHSFNNGVVSRTFFDNGYGVSVVKHDYSYGGDKGLYELAVLNENGDLTYDTPITEDVIGWNTKEEVSAMMKVLSHL